MTQVVPEGTSARGTRRQGPWGRLDSMRTVRARARSFLVLGRGGGGLRPLLAGPVALIIVALVSIQVGRTQTQAAQRQRLGDRSLLVARLANWMDSTANPTVAVAAASQTPFSPTNQTLNDLLLTQFLAASPSGDTFAQAAIYSPTGQVLAAQPDDWSRPVPAYGTAWSSALAGRAALTGVLTGDGAVRRATLVPLGGTRPWGVLTLVTSDISTPRYSAQPTDTGRDPASINEVDANGIAATGSSLAAAGRPALTAAKVAEIRRSYPKPLVWSSEVDGRTLTGIAQWQPMTAYLTLYRQPTSGMYSDIHAAAHRRDATVLELLTVGVACIVAVGVLRERLVGRARSRARALLSATDDLILVLDEDLRLILASPVADRDRAKHWPCLPLATPFLDHLYPGDRDRVTRALSGRQSTTILNVRFAQGAGVHGASSGGGDQAAPAADEAGPWCDIDVADLSHEAHQSGLSAGTRRSGFLVTCHDVSYRKNAEDVLARQATQDALTGLGNRSLFETRLRATLADVVQDGHTPALLFVDLDHFKPVNDTYGHAAGDETLRVAARRIQAALPDGDLAYRLGGDEFAAVLHDAGPDAARVVADRIAAAIREPIPLAAAAAAVQVSASVGGAVAVSGTESGHLCRVADAAMYTAKRSGGDRTRVVTAARPRSARVRTDVLAADGATADNATADGALIPTPLPRPAADSDVPEPPGSRPAPGPPAPAGAAARRSAGSGRSWRQRAAPVAIVALLLLATVGLGLHQEARGQQQAHDQRRVEMLAFTTKIADVASLSTPDDQIPILSAVPWTFTAADAGILAAIRHGRATGPGTSLILAAPDGKVIASDPPRATSPVPTSAVDWRTALSGHSGGPILHHEGGDLWWSQTVPIVRSDRTVAVLIMYVQMRASSYQAALQAYGKRGYEDGGLSIIDRNGLAILSWNPKLLGTRLVDPTVLATLPAGQAAQVPSTTAGTTTLVARIATVPDGGYVVLRQSTAEFYAGISMGGAFHDLLLFLIIAVVLIGLVLSNSAREAAIRREKLELDALLHNTHDIVTIVDRNRRVSFVSSAVDRLVGRRPEMVLGTDLAALAHPADQARLRELLRHRRDDGDRVQDVRIPAVDGTIRWFDVVVAPARASHDAGSTLVTCKDVSVRKELRDSLREAARRDPLTGLPNRVALREYLDALNAGPQRNLAMLFIDLDAFKPVNDSYGHETGDEVLRITANRLRGACRQSGRGDRVFRLGGDEFVAVLPGVDTADAGRLAERIATEIRRPMAHAAGTLTIRATIGVAATGPGLSRPDDVLHDADQAMYRGKPRRE